MNENDKQIKLLLAEILQKEECLSRAQKYTNITSMVLSFEGKEYNLNTVSDSELLTRMYIWFKSQSNLLFELTRCDIHLEVLVNTIQGYKYSDWETDIFNRLKRIHYQNKVKALKSAKTKIEGLLSEDAKTADALSFVKDLLSKL